MHELTTIGTLVEATALGDATQAAVLSTEELGAPYRTEEPARLWIELAQEGFDEPTRVTIDLAPHDLETILGAATKGEVALVFDDAVLASLAGEHEVEAHGLRGAIALAVVSTAVAAPTAQAATPQEASPTASAQRASVVVAPQRMSLAARLQVSTQVANAAVPARPGAARAGGLRLLRAGIAR
jgi:hypothetical protein